jgi:uncharacterized protein (DUF433 family)
LEYPFAQAKFKADGAEALLEMEEFGESSDRNALVSASGSGQLVWGNIVAQRLRQFNYGEDGSVDLWRVRGDESPVRIEPRVAFGAPHVCGTPTWIIKAHWRSGESISDIADDFTLELATVAKALKFEGIVVDYYRPNKWAN